MHKDHERAIKLTYKNTVTFTNNQKMEVRLMKIYFHRSTADILKIVNILQR